MTRALFSLPEVKMADLKLICVGLLFALGYATFGKAAAVKNPLIIDRGDMIIPEPIEGGGSEESDEAGEEELAVDGVPLAHVPREFHTLLLEWVLRTDNGEDMNGAFTCTTQPCLDQIDEYVRWRESNDVGKSSIRW